MLDRKGQLDAGSGISAIFFISVFQSVCMDVYKTFSTSLKSMWPLEVCIGIGTTWIPQVSWDSCGSKGNDYCIVGMVMRIKLHCVPKTVTFCFFRITLSNVDRFQ